MQRKARDGKIRKIEFAFYNERKIRDAVTEARAGGSRHDGAAGGNSSHISKPTENAAIRLAVELPFVTLDNGGTVELPERWLAVIDAVRAWCASDAVRAGIFRRRYGGEEARAVQTAMGISVDTYKHSLLQIRQFAVACAAQAQVVKVF